MADSDDGIDGMPTGLVQGLGRLLGLRKRLRRFVRREIQAVTGPLKQDVLRKLDEDLGKERKISDRQVRDLLRQLKALRLANADLSDSAAQSAHRLELLERIVIENDRDRDALLTLADRMDFTRLSDHVHDRLQAAEVQTTPYPHIFLEQALPEDFYRSACRLRPAARSTLSRGPREPARRSPPPFPGPGRG